MPIQLNNMTEKEYRTLPIDSYSSFKLFLEDRKKYYKRYVLGETVPEKEELAIKIGALVDAMVLTPDEIDEKFHISTGKLPSGNMLQLAEAAYRRTIENMEDNVLTVSFEEILQMAYNDVKYDKQGNEVAFKQKGVGSFEAIAIRFASECKDYYDEILSCRKMGKMLVTNEDIQNAEKIKDELMTNKVTAQLMRQKTTDEITVENQVVVLFEINGHKVKGLIDKRITDHVKKTIKPWDLKVTWNVEEFEDKYFFYRRSDLQAAIYYLGCIAYRDEHYPDYSVEPMGFIVADSINYMNPLIYEASEDLVNAAIGGYTRRGWEYPGLAQIINDIKWAKENDVWHISRENYLNNGVKKLKIT